jgi:short-subunit dehydrogenase
MKNRTVVIVGATGGIGAAVAQQLAPLGANLVLAARSRDRLEAIAATLPHPALTIPTDITDRAQVERLMSEAVAEFGRIDVLVNAAGAGVMKQFNKLEPADFDAMLDLNLKGLFYTCQSAANVMKGQKAGHICNVIGILGKHPMITATAYCASKYGAVGMSKCLADELKRYGVKFTLCYFGGVNTPFWDQAGLKVDRTKLLSPETAANAIVHALQVEPAAIPLEINIQPESHLFL